MEHNANVRTVVTGLGWMGAGAGSVDTAITELVTSASQELLILAYSITAGAGDLFQLIRDRLSHGVRVVLVVDRWTELHQLVRSALVQMQAEYPSHCRLYAFSDTDAHLHAKVIIADRIRALVGSANLSWHGLVTNHELGVLIDGPAVSELALVADRLLHHRAILRIDEGT